VYIVRIKFTPRITGKDVRRIMNSPEVDDELALLGIEQTKAHDLVKKIMIVSFTNSEWDINKIISDR
jgi:hypothetical protein